VVNAWVAAMVQYEAELATKNSEGNSPKTKMKRRVARSLRPFGP